MRGPATAIPRSTASRVRVAAPAAPATASEPDRQWDLLLGCVAAHILTAVGRVHQLFPILGALRPAIVTGILAIALYLMDGREERRLARLWVPATKYLLALFGWMILSVPNALVAGNSFDLVFGGFVKTVLLFLITAGTIRGIRDVERLGGVYLVAGTAYAGVVITTFDLGTGANWRLGHLYYYDANDLATFLVTAVPFGLFFLQPLCDEGPLQVRELRREQPLVAANVVAVRPQAGKVLLDHRRLLTVVMPSLCKRKSPWRRKN